MLNFYCHKTTKKCSGCRCIQFPVQCLVIILWGKKERLVDWGVYLCQRITCCCYCNYSLPHLTFLFLPMLFVHSDFLYFEKLLPAGKFNRGPKWQSLSVICLVLFAVVHFVSSTLLSSSDFLLLYCLTGSSRGYGASILSVQGRNRRTNSSKVRKWWQCLFKFKITNRLNFWNFKRLI